MREHEVSHSCAEVRQSRREDAIKHEKARGEGGGRGVCQSGRRGGSRQPDHACNCGEAGGGGQKRVSADRVCSSSSWAEGLDSRRRLAAAVEVGRREARARSMRAAAAVPRKAGRLLLWKAAAEFADALRRCLPPRAQVADEIGKIVRRVLFLVFFVPNQNLFHF